MRHLLTAYATVPGDQFTRYIQGLQDKIDEASIEEVKKYTPKHVMDLVKNKFRALQQDNLWDTQTSTSSKFLALKAKVNRISDRQRGRQKTGKDKHGRPHKGRPTRPRVNRDKQNSALKFESLKRIKPENLKDVIMHNDKKFVWCGKDTGGHCEMFVRHDPKDCKGLKPSEDKKKAPPKRRKQYGTMVVKAAEALEKDDDSHEDDDDVSMSSSQA